MSGRHSGIAILAAVTALLVASCTTSPTAERSTSPVPTESIRPATASGRADAPTPTATAGSATPAATPSASPPAPEPSPLATDPVPATTALPPLVPGPLRIDGLARVVVDRLRVRSAPDVRASSERLEPLLDSGTMLFVLDGPVAGSGYDWYRVAPLGDGGDPHYEFDYYYAGVAGWVASGARDGAPWIIGLDPDCPDPVQSQSTQCSQVQRAEGDGGRRTLAGNGLGACIWLSLPRHQIGAGCAGSRWP